MKETVRVPAVAGLFYPADPEALRRMIQGFLDQATRGSLPSPKAILVPHAGLIYSGPIAASAYAQIVADGIERVVLIGPSHRVAFYGVAAPESHRWETPLGNIEIDRHALDKISQLSPVVFSDRIHEEEHSLEVQLPFLQRLLGPFNCVPLVTGEASKSEVATVLNALWGGPETVIVISSDLSHYESYERAKEKDGATARAIEALNVRGLDSDCACGLTPIAGFLEVARQKGLTVEVLDLRNSGDTAGPRDQVVGYGSFAFYE